ncbi:MAG: hypothetical protein ACI9Z7_001493 [Alteromonas macleodii]
MFWKGIKSINNHLLKKPFLGVFMYSEELYFYNDEKGERNSDESVSVRSEQVHFYVFNILGLDDILR